MRDAERVVDVGVGEPRVGLRQLGVVLRLPRLEADVLEHQDLARVEPGGEPLLRLPDDAGRERHVPAGQLGEPVGGGPQRERRVHPLRASEVRREDQRAARVVQAPQGRQRRADARVVGDVARLVERDVEVHAHEDAPAGEIDVVKGPHRGD